MSIEENQKNLPSWATIVCHAKEPHTITESKEDCTDLTTTEEEGFNYPPDVEFDDYFGNRIFDHMYDIYNNYYEEFKFYDMSFSKIYELFRNRVDLMSVLSNTRDELTESDNDRGDMEYDAANYYHTD
jgi:hypothetical protein